MWQFNFGTIEDDDVVEMLIDAMMKNINIVNMSFKYNLNIDMVR